MAFGNIWNRVLFWVGLFCLCACSGMDPDIPNYESQIEDSLPVVVIKSADHLFLREVTLHVDISSKSDHIPQSLYLCYDKVLN